MSSCFFIGHRETMGDVFPQLIDAIERHITQYGVDEFVVGHYGGFDRVVIRALTTVKAYHPEIKLLLLIPYHPSERPIEAPPCFDGTFYPPGMEQVPRKYAIVNANRYMIDHAEYLIAYVWHPASNARELMEYAKKRGVCITNLGERRSVDGKK